MHDARRHLKRLRALYQLCREPLGKELCARETAILRDVARHLSAVRDVEVKVAALEVILQETQLGQNAAVRKLHLAWMRERDRQVRLTSSPARVRGLLDSLNAARRRFDLLPILEGDWHLVAQALSRSYRRARNGFGAIKDQPADDERLHEWRKLVKILEYQLAVLRRMHRNVSGLSRNLHRLTDCLGEEHDLFVLMTSLSESQAAFLKTSSGRQVRTLIEKRRTKLKRRALKLGANFFGEKTPSFISRLHEWWDEWR